MKVGFGTIIKNALVLFAITLVAGLALGFVYQMTKEPIAAQEREAQRLANQAVFPAAADFSDELPLDEGVAAQLAGDATYGKVSIISAKKALDAAGQGIGYCVQVSNKGYGDKIVFTVGISNEGQIGGISIVSINETPGLGMNANKVLVPQFTDKPAGVFAVTKSAASSSSEIEAISGATPG